MEKVLKELIAQDRKISIDLLKVSEDDNDVETPEGEEILGMENNFP